MEYADSGNLQSYLKKSFSDLTWDDKCNMGYQIACAVSCLHNEGIVHRDLVIYVTIQSLVLYLHSVTHLLYFNSILVIY